MPRSLAGKVPRVFDDHTSEVARRYRAHYVEVLAPKYGPFTDGFTRSLAAMAATAYVVWQLASDRHAEATLARLKGKGRKPSALLVRQTEKRAAMSQQSYFAALARLETACATRPTAGHNDEVDFSDLDTETAH
jgi:hypothetical protein